MKVPAFATALLALAASSPLALAEDTPARELWVAILGYKSRDAIIDATLQLATSSDDDFEPSPTPTEIVTWAANCMEGSYVSIVPEDPFSEADFNPADWGINVKDLEHLHSDEFDWNKKSDQDLYRKIMNKMLDRFKYEYKLYWFTDAETMKKSECQQSAVGKAVDTMPYMVGVFKVIKYEKVNMTAKQLSSCLSDTSSGSTDALHPVCGPPASGGVEDPTKAKNCVACAISTMVVGAMIAASLFF